MIDKLLSVLTRYLNSEAALIVALALWWLIPPIAGLLVRFIWGLVRGPKKRLVWRIFQRMQLPRTGSEGLTAAVHDRKINDAGVVIFDVSSSGRDAIGKDDLPDGKMVLTFGNAKVESYERIETTSTDLDMHPVLNGSRFELTVDFFNRGESAKYRVVLSNYDEARDKITSDRRLKDGHIRLAEWDMPGHVDEWGKAFLSAFVVLLGSFLVLFFISLLIGTTTVWKLAMLALGMSLAIAAVHCWVATEARREEAEERAYGRGPLSWHRQVWVPVYIYFKQLFANKFYLRMIVVGWVLGMAPHTLGWLITVGRQTLERLR